MPSNDPSLRRLFGDLIGETTRLIRGELRLIQAEGQEKASQIQSGMIAVGIGAVLGWCGLLILLLAAVAGIAHALPIWLSLLIVGAVAALIGLGLLAQGMRNIKPRNMVPERTLKSFRDTRDMVEEKIT